MSGSAGARGSCDAAGASRWLVVVHLWPIWQAESPMFGVGN
jgi:hypothetical protein